MEDKNEKRVCRFLRMPYFFLSKIPFVRERFEARREVEAWKSVQQKYRERAKEIVEWARGREGYEQEIEFYESHDYEMFPYDWCDRGKVVGKTRLHDEDGLKYVWHKERKLFLGSRNQYAQLITEQMEHSPHKYFSELFSVPDGAVFCDVGAAEGMMALDYIEVLSKAYLIESDSNWIINLEHTFKPFKDKTIIVSKYASDKNDEENISLDSLLADEKARIVMKIDVEGMEEEVLAGAMNVLRNKEVLVVMAIYHKPEDEEMFTSFFSNLGYHYEISEGYGYLSFLEPPLLRKVIIRAKNFE